MEQAQALAEEQERRAEAERLRAEEQERQTREQIKAAKRLRRLLWITAALAMIVVGVAIIAVSKSMIAQEQTRVAQEQTRVAQEQTRRATVGTVGRLASQTLIMLNTNLDLALLLSVQATRMMSPPTFEARSSLIRVLEHSPALNKVLHGHTAGVWSMAFSPDGTRLASASGDGTVRLWESTTGQPVGKPFEGHTAAVSSVAFSPDGTRLASASGDGTVRLWESHDGAASRQALRGAHSCGVQRGLQPRRHAAGLGQRGQDGAPMGEPRRGSQ